MARKSKLRLAAKSTPEAKKSAIPFVSRSSNSWNRAAVLFSAEHSKLPSAQKKIPVQIHRIPDKPNKLKLSTNEWNRKALLRVSTVETEE